MQKSVRTLSYAPGPLDNEMQRQVRETLGDPEQKQLYTNLANEVSWLLAPSSWLLLHRHSPKLTFDNITLFLTL